MKEIKLHLGCGWRDFGDDWIHIDDGDYNHLDYKTDVTKLSMFKDNSVDLIYASHVIAYFDREEIKKVLIEWKRVLKPNGRLRLATPDFNSMINLYSNNYLVLDDILGPLYGKMSMDKNTIYHKTVYDFKSIKKLLNKLGFNSVKKYNWKKTEHANFDDHSQAYIPHLDKENGVLISLNIECTK